jgi:predicted DNA-binding protein (UPF0251 family)
MERTIQMTEKEIERIKVIQMAQEKRITQKEGSRRLGISERHFRRVLKGFQKKGNEGVISKRRGQPSNNRMAEDKRHQIVEFIQRPIFKGFGPTLLNEKLEEYENILISKETLRQIMIEEKIHKPKTKKKSIPHPLREARPRRGELVQIDGSYHAWLEDRGPKACLLLFVDDATHEVLAAQFVEQETYFSYGTLCKSYFKENGLPVAFYSDRFSVFRVNAKNVIKTDAITEFGRALQDLQIELICANSPQAKGRVERANQTFQDRLVKELRLQKINDYQQANAYLPKFIAFYNRKFAVLPRSLEDAHCPLPASVDLDFIFSIHDSRKISKDLNIQFNKVVYHIITSRPAYALVGRDVLATIGHDQKAAFYLNGKALSVEVVHLQPKQASVVSSKSISRSIHKPAPDHPWRNYPTTL